MASRTPTIPLAPPDDDAYVAVATGPPQHLDICALVLCAVHIDHILQPESGLLLVRQKDAAAATMHLECYFRENRDWPPPKPPLPPFSADSHPPTLLLMGTLAIFYSLTGPWQLHVPWFQAGSVNARAVLDQHQWWRLVTALTLHADQAHLLSNCLFGGLIVHLLSKSVGYGLGWLLLVTTGAAGNLLNMLLRPPYAGAVGFSTAIFAAIGILCGLQLTGRAAFSPRRLLVPLGAGASLLAALGAQGEHTDISGHFFGLLSGLLGGTATQYFGLSRYGKNSLLQFLFLLAAGALIISCWLLAWETVPQVPLHSGKNP